MLQCSRLKLFGTRGCLAENPAENTLQGQQQPGFGPAERSKKNKQQTTANDHITQTCQHWSFWIAESSVHGYAGQAM